MGYKRLEELLPEIRSADALLTSRNTTHNVEADPHNIAPDATDIDNSLHDFSSGRLLKSPTTDEYTMNTNENERYKRLRPRNNKIANKIGAKAIQDKIKRNTSSKATPSKSDDLTLKSDSPSILHLLCPYCDRKFASKQALSKHTRRMHLSLSKQDLFIECLFCNHADADSNDIIRHMVDNHENQYFACLNCHSRFMSISELAEHKLSTCEKQKHSYRSKLRSKESANKKQNFINIQHSYSNDKKGYTDGHGFNGVVISCELKPAQVHDEADIEDNITTNLILPPNKNLSSTVIEKNAVIVLDDIQWNKRIPSNFSFHNTDADQILSRLGVVHRSPRVGDSSKRDWQKINDDSNQKFEKCFDTSFYSKVASNVHENLAKFLDGSFNFNPDPDNTIKTRKAKNSVVINTAEGFPILLAYEQFSRNVYDAYLPRPIVPKYKWKWEQLENYKNVMSLDQIKRDSHSHNCIITLVSSLDIWTQLCMRRKYEEKFNNTLENKSDKQNIVGKELKEILESREIPSSSSQIVKYSNKPIFKSEGLEFPASLGLLPTSPSYDLQLAVLSGEWVRPRCYVCCACGAQTRDSRGLSSHISSHHPNAQVENYEIVGEPLLNADILKHLYVPPSQMINRTRPLRGFRECTKCGKSISLEDLHQHMLDCAGDTPTVRRKCRYRPFGVRKRRPRLPDNTIRKKIRKDIRTRQTGQKSLMSSRPKIRSEVGDAETIRKMLADLPAKRHRVMINPLNSMLRPRKNLERQRNMLMMKRRPSDDPKNGKHLVKDKNFFMSNEDLMDDNQNKNMSHKGDEDSIPLKCRRVLRKNIRQHENIKRKSIMRRPKKRILREKEQNAHKVNMTEFPKLLRNSSTRQNYDFLNNKTFNGRTPHIVETNNDISNTRKFTEQGGSEEIASGPDELEPNKTQGNQSELSGFTRRRSKLKGSERTESDLNRSMRRERKLNNLEMGDLSSSSNIEKEGLASDVPEEGGISRIGPKSNDPGEADPSDSEKRSEHSQGRPKRSGAERSILKPRSSKSSGPEPNKSKSRESGLNEAGKSWFESSHLEKGDSKRIPQANKSKRSSLRSNFDQRTQEFRGAKRRESGLMDNEQRSSKRIGPISGRFKPRESDPNISEHEKERKSTHKNDFKSSRTKGDGVAFNGTEKDWSEPIESKRNRSRPNGKQLPAGPGESRQSGSKRSGPGLRESRNCEQKRDELEPEDLKPSGKRGELDPSKSNRGGSNPSRKCDGLRENERPSLKPSGNQRELQSNTSDSEHSTEPNDSGGESKQSKSQKDASESSGGGNGSRSFGTERGGSAPSRSEQGGPDRGGTSSNDGRHPNPNRHDRIPQNFRAPASNVPLKHSIASLTANSETHDKAVQFHQTFLVQQECNNANEHVPTGQELLFENETVITKLDKPPLYCQKELEPLLQKFRLNKPRKGLDDCISMLKSKLVDPVCSSVPVPVSHISVQCGTDEPIYPTQKLSLQRDVRDNSKAHLIHAPVETVTQHSSSFEMSQETHSDNVLSQGKCDKPHERDISRRENILDLSITGYSNPNQNSTKTTSDEGYVKSHSSRRRSVARIENTQPQQFTNSEVHLKTKSRRTSNEISGTESLAGQKPVKVNTRRSSSNLKHANIESGFNKRSAVHDKFIRNNASQNSLYDQELLKQLTQYGMGYEYPIPITAQSLGHPSQNIYIDQISAGQYLMAQTLKDVFMEQMSLGQQIRSYNSQGQDTMIYGHGNNLSPGQEIRLNSLKTTSVEPISTNHDSVIYKSKNAWKEQASSSQLIGSYINYSSGLSESRSVNDSASQTAIKTNWMELQPNDVQARTNIFKGLLIEPNPSDHSHTSKSSWVAQKLPRQRRSSLQKSVSRNEKSNSQDFIPKHKHKNQRSPGQEKHKNVSFDSKSSSHSHDINFQAPKIILNQNYPRHRLGSTDYKSISTEINANSLQTMLPTETDKDTWMHQQPTCQHEVVNVHKSILTAPIAVTETTSYQECSEQQGNASSCKNNLRDSRSTEQDLTVHVPKYNWIQQQQIQQTSPKSTDQSLSANQNLLIYATNCSLENDSQNQEVWTCQSKSIPTDVDIKEQDLATKINIVDPQLSIGSNRSLNENPSKINEQKSVTIDMDPKRVDPSYSDGQLDSVQKTQTKDYNKVNTSESISQIHPEKDLIRDYVETISGNPDNNYGDNIPHIPPTFINNNEELNLSIPLDLSGKSQNATSQILIPQNSSFILNNYDNYETLDLSYKNTNVHSNKINDMRNDDDVVDLRIKSTFNSSNTDESAKLNKDEDIETATDLSLKAFDTDSIPTDLSIESKSKNVFTEHIEDNICDRVLSVQNTIVSEIMDTSFDIATDLSGRSKHNPDIVPDTLEATDDYKPPMICNTKDNISIGEADDCVQQPSNVNTETSHLIKECDQLEDNEHKKTHGKRSKKSSFTHADVAQKTLYNPILNTPQSKTLPTTKSHTSDSEEAIASIPVTADCQTSDVSIKSTAVDFTSPTTRHDLFTSIGTVLPIPSTISTSHIGSFPIYTLANSCIPVKKIETSTCETSSTLLNNPGTNIAPTTSVYTLAGATTGARSNYGSYIAPACLNNDDLTVEDEKRCSIYNVTSDSVDNLGNVVIKNDETKNDIEINADQDPETARKIAMLPRELVEILGTMPVGHRNQLLNVLPQYVSTTAPNTKLVLSSESLTTSVANDLKNPPLYLSSNAPLSSTRVAKSTEIDKNHTNPVLVSSPIQPSINFNVNCIKNEYLLDSSNTAKEIINSDTISKISLANDKSSKNISQLIDLTDEDKVLSLADIETNSLSSSGAKLQQESQNFPLAKSNPQKSNSDKTASLRAVRIKTPAERHKSKSLDNQTLAKVSVEQLSENSNVITDKSNEEMNTFSNSNQSLAIQQAEISSTQLSNKNVLTDTSTRLSISPPNELELLSKNSNIQKLYRVSISSDNNVVNEDKAHHSPIGGGSIEPVIVTSSITSNTTSSITGNTTLSVTGNTTSSITGNTTSSITGNTTSSNIISYIPKTNNKIVGNVDVSCNVPLSSLKTEREQSNIDLPKSNESAVLLHCSTSELNIEQKPQQEISNIQEDDSDDNVSLAAIVEQKRRDQNLEEKNNDILKNNADKSSKKKYRRKKNTGMKNNKLVLPEKLNLNENNIVLTNKETVLTETNIKSCKQFQTCNQDSKEHMEHSPVMADVDNSIKKNNNKLNAELAKTQTEMDNVDNSVQNFCIERNDNDNIRKFYNDNNTNIVNNETNKKENELFIIQHNNECTSIEKNEKNAPRNNMNSKKLKLYSHAECSDPNEDTKKEENQDQFESEGNKDLFSKNQTRGEQENPTSSFDSTNLKKEREKDTDKPKLLEITPSDAAVINDIQGIKAPQDNALNLKKDCNEKDKITVLKKSNDTDFPIAITDPNVLQQNNEVKSFTTPVRRSRRGKSLIVDSNSNDDGNIIHTDTIMENARLPLTKKQLIFSKLLLDEENNSKVLEHSRTETEKVLEKESLLKLSSQNTTDIEHKEDNYIENNKPIKRKKCLPIKRKSKKMKLFDKVVNNDNYQDVKESHSDTLSVHLDLTPTPPEHAEICETQMEPQTNNNDTDDTANNELTIENNLIKTVDNPGQKEDVTTRNKSMKSMESKSLNFSNSDNVNNQNSRPKKNRLNKKEQRCVAQEDDTNDKKIIRSDKIATNFETRITTCYSVPLAAKRSRSKSVGVNSSGTAFYDPYDIDMDDMIKKVEPLRKKNLLGENFRNKSKIKYFKPITLHTKSSISHKTASKSLEDKDNHIANDDLEEKDVKDLGSDSDESSKSDVPLKKYLNEKEKKKSIKRILGNKIENDIATLQNKTEEEMRSEKFMQSFGFFSERKPRKSNLLATKKISETFHVANESDDMYFGIKSRSTKKSSQVDRKCENSFKVNQQYSSKKTSKRGRNKVTTKRQQSYCLVCKKEFRRPDNFLRHQMTLLHVSKLSEIELNIKTTPVYEELNYFIPYIEELNKRKLLEKQLSKRKKNSKGSKIVLPNLLEILENVQKKMREYLARRALSKDESLFIQCCELLKESHRIQTVPPVTNNTTVNVCAPQVSVSGLEFAHDVCDNKCNIKNERILDPIAAKKILESEEVLSLENDLITGFREAANASSANSSIKHRNLSHEISINKFEKSVENLSSTNISKCQYEMEHFDTSENNNKNNKNPAYKADLFDNIDMYEDKFDKIKRKSRSQAAAAKQTKTVIESSISHKVRKKSDKRKMKKRSKKSSKNAVPTKGALKGFDGIKVSIPTSDINISAIVAPLESNKEHKEKKKRKNNRKRRARRDSTSSAKCDANYYTKDISTPQKKVDVYEFKDNDDVDLFEFRPSTLMERFKSMGNKEVVIRSTLNSTSIPSKVISTTHVPDSNASCSSTSDGDDFVYMSDDYVCSDDETESSLMSCELSNGKVSSDSKRKRKDVVEKNAVMDKIFKNNAVRTEKKCSKSKEPEKPKANLDQLFDSLLDKEPNSSMITNDATSKITAESHNRISHKDHGLLKHRTISKTYDHKNPDITVRDKLDTVSPKDYDTTTSPSMRSTRKEYGYSSPTNYDATKKFGPELLVNKDCPKKDTMSSQSDSCHPKNKNFIISTDNDEKSLMSKTRDISLVDDYESTTYKKNMPSDVQILVTHDKDNSCNPSDMEYRSTLVKRNYNISRLDYDSSSKNIIFKPPICKNHSISSDIDVESASMKHGITSEIENEETKSFKNFSKLDHSPSTYKKNSYSGIDYSPLTSKKYPTVLDSCSLLSSKKYHSSDSDHDSSRLKRYHCVSLEFQHELSPSQKYQSSEILTPKKRPLEVDHDLSISKKHISTEAVPSESKKYHASSYVDYGPSPTREYDISSVGCGRTSKKHRNSSEIDYESLITRKYSSGSDNYYNKNFHCYSENDEQFSQNNKYKSEKYHRSSLGNYERSTQKKCSVTSDLDYKPFIFRKRDDIYVDYVPATSKKCNDIPVNDYGPTAFEKYNAIAGIPSTPGKYISESDDDIAISKKCNKASSLLPKDLKSTQHKTHEIKSKKSPKYIDHSKDKSLKSKTELWSFDEEARSDYNCSAEFFKQASPSDEAGVARQRARRKCTVGKQNVLAETWSSESEPDDVPPRPRSAESVMFGAGRKKRGRKREFGGRRGNSKHVTFKKHEYTESRVTCSNRNTLNGSASSGSAGRGGSSGRWSSAVDTGAGEGIVEPSAALSVRALPGSPKGPRRPVAYNSFGDDESRAVPDDEKHLQEQHGWIVGDSHKKLVTMLAHAKGRRNNDDKRRYN